VTSATMHSVMMVHFVFVFILSLLTVHWKDGELSLL
jgi:hypothetical protein